MQYLPIVIYHHVCHDYRMMSRRGHAASFRSGRAALTGAGPVIHKPGRGRPAWRLRMAGRRPGRTWSAFGKGPPSTSTRAVAQ
jgi:hypothetical protein